LSAELTRYFPEPIRRRFPERLKRHRLRREIIATAITNSLINRMGPVFPVRTQADTGADPAAIARGFTIAREVLDLRDIWTQVEALSVRVASAVQYAAIEHTTRILRHQCYWLLTNQRGDLDIDRAVARFRPGVAALLRDVGAILGTEELARFTALQAKFVADGMPAGLAARIASLDPLHGALDLVEVAAAARLPIAFAARAYYQIGERLGLAWLKQQVESLPAEGHWHAVARGALRENLYALQRKLSAAVLAGPGEGPAQRVAAWITRHAGEVGYLEALIADLRTGSAPDFATLSVALHAVARLAGA
jgi:glutamate dehydrogenase